MKYHDPSIEDRLNASEIQGLEELEIPEDLHITPQDIADSAARLDPELREVQSILSISAHSRGKIVM